MKALIVFNPYSGYYKIKNKIKYIQNRILTKYKDVDVFESKSKDDLYKKIVSDAIMYKLLVVIGGDGTLNIVSNALMQLVYRPVIGYIPSGTANDIGKNLGLNKKKLDKSINVILNGIVEKMDICKINDQYFLYAQAVGKYTSISYNIDSNFKKKLGKLAYILNALKHLNDSSKLETIIKTRNEVISGSFYVIMSLNSQRVGGFRIYRRHQIKLNDGLIDLTLIKNNKIFSFLNLVSFFLIGDFNKAIKNVSLSEFSINLKEELPFNTDGEYAFTSNTAKICVINKAISIMVSAKIKKKMFI